MRVRFDQTLTPAELKGEIAALCDDLEGLGIDHLAGANLYFNPIIEGRYVELRSEAGTVLSFLSIET
jgi:hypothetical protein